MRPLLALAALAATLAALLVPADAGAIPAFARRYRFSCTTCHAPFPRLKPYGEEFAGRGFALDPGQEPARAQVDLGDDLLQLPREFPISLRFDAFAQAAERPGGDVSLDFQTPWIFKLLAGGEIARGVGFFAYYILEQGEPGKIEDAYLQLTRVLGLPADLFIGQFQLCDPIAKRELRLQRLDYEILTVGVGLSRVNLTYDRGLALGAALGPVGALLTATNGNGIVPATGGRFDDDRFKNFGLHLGGDVGPLTLGAYGFYGKQQGEQAVNDTAYLGAHAAVAAGPVTLAAVWLERRDSNAFFDPAGAGTIRTRGGYLEATAYPTGADGRLVLTALYNRVDSSEASARRESAALAATFLLRRNIRLTAEVDQDWQFEAWSASLGTVAAF